MANMSFPKPVKWRSGSFTSANGEPVPHPTEWATQAASLDDSKIDFDTLLDEEEIPHTPTNKKARTE
jgi:hypothetical protein